MKKCFRNEVSSDIAMLNTICKSHANDAHCPNCEMQFADDHGINYVKNVKVQLKSECVRPQCSAKLHQRANYYMLPYFWIISSARSHA